MVDYKLFVKLVDTNSVKGKLVIDFYKLSMYYYAFLMHKRNWR